MAYICTMEFEWDETKSEACFEKRGFDFAYATRAFFDTNRVIEPDDRRDYGEERYRLRGSINGRLYVVIYTLRHSAIRIISAHKASHRETQRHENSAHQS